MENLLDDFEPVEHFTDKEILTKIWTIPKPIFKYIHHYRYEKRLTLLLVLAGITNAFDKSFSKNIGSNNSIIETLIFSIIGGALLGWISYYIYSGLLRWTGSWLKGTASSDAILRVLVYASIPTITSLVLVLPKLLLINNTESNFYTPSNYAIAIIDFILSVWTIVLSIAGIAEIQQFSIGKAIVNLLLPIFIILIPIFLIMYVIWGFH